MTKNNHISDVIIIGSGPAGLTAAIQLKRLGITSLLIEKESIGGSLPNANLIENYPGFPKGISGQKLTNLIITQFKKYNLNTIFDDVKDITKKNDLFEIKLPNETLLSKSVIVATGTKPNKLNLNNEEKLQNDKKLFYEVKNIPKNINSSKVIIIGGGDSAFDYAINLSKTNNNITILSRSKPCCIELLEKRVKNIKNISILKNCQVISFDHTICKTHKTKTHQIALKCKSNETHKIIIADYMLVAIGRKPKTNLLAKLQLEKDFPNIPGFFIAGDVKNGLNRQLGVAIGDSLTAAIKVKEYLTK